MTNQQLWQAVLGEMELVLSKANFTTWFKGTFIAENNEEKMIIGVPNAFTKNWLEKKYNNYILKSLQNITERRIRHIEYHVNPKIKEDVVIKTTEEVVVSLPEQLPSKDTCVKEEELFCESEKLKKNGLNPRYRFDNFVVGNGNELAHAAAQAIVQKPGTSYNPFFLYGGVGLGKTHLIQALGNEINKKYPDLKVLYVTCEQFTNEFIEEVRKGTVKKLKDTYRTVDLLIIDDIQFIAGKEQTQEEFFHTFNELHQKNKQIILSSDRPPKAIPALEKRLISRFEWGMIADISNPDLETRIAILEKKCAERKFDLNREIIEYVAMNIKNNIRELEGALNRIIAYSQLRKIEPTLENIKIWLTSLAAKPLASSLTPKQLINIVASYYDVSFEDLIGISRKSELVLPRQITMYLLREDLKISYPHIGQELGGRDHTTAMHACTKIIREIEANEKVRNDVESLKQRIYSQSEA